MKKLQNYINGLYIDPVDNQWIENINPATGKVISLIPNSNKADIELAIQASKKAFNSWCNTNADQRFTILNKIADLISENLEELALAETLDTGKPLKASRTIDIPRAASNFRFFATAAVQFASESHHSPGVALNYTLREAIGLVACISPWNLPLYLFTWKIAPALASGNCVIAKPSELSPTTAYMLGDICSKAGLPAGVLNIVQGLGKTTGQSLIEHEDIKAISFTGGTTTGAHIASLAAPKFKKLSLELGGKNPCIVFDDCDYEKTLSEVMRLAFSNQGQICLCGSRILVQKSLYEILKEDLIQKTQKLIIGNPLDEKTQIGSLISKEHKEKVMRYIELAKEEGGRILVGGAAFEPGGDISDGAYVMPTIIENLGPTCRTNMEEIFGPVITLQSFESEEEAIQLANESHYGLAATIWTSDLNKAHRVASKVNTGIVWINCWLLRDLRTAFGGMNQSGVGREGGWEAMRFFTEPKNVCIKLS